MLYSKMANKGAFLPLNELMQQYAPTLYQTYQDNGSLTACSIDGQLVALPWVNEKSSKAILLYRKDLADQYGVTVNELKTIEDLDAFLTEAHEKVPNIISLRLNRDSREAIPTVTCLLCSTPSMRWIP